MKVIIIEDELLAQAKLEAMLNALDRSIEVIAKINSVQEALRWIAGHPAPDLAFVDIQLSDDHAFEIFRMLPVNFPVIFTTAYDKYIMESFEFNSVDYLLKPITEEKLKRSLDKLKKLEHHFLHGNIMKLIEHASPQLRTRIVAKKGNEFVALDLDEVAYFYTEHKLVFVRDFSGRHLIVDKNLADLESTLDRSRFFRINRKYIAQLKAIEKFKPDKGKIRIFLRPETKEEVHVSKETAPLFRKWIGATES